MKRIITLIIVVAASFQMVVAQKYFTKSGHIWFHSEAPLETIEAHNRQVTSILDAATGEMVFKVRMKSFQFEKALMQEHFNEKYVDSDKYPEATFKGNIVNLSNVDLGRRFGTYSVTVKGDLTIHGVTQPIETKGTITVIDNKVTAKAVFPAKLDDFNIKIPGAVKDNIAETVDITVEMEYEPMGG